jgi:HD-GYP domain-containing protein (c-di-GMP phosphodiesterase class II)
MTIRSTHTSVIARLVHRLGEWRGADSVERATRLADWASDLADQLGWELEERERLREAALALALTRHLRELAPAGAVIGGLLDDAQQDWVALEPEHRDGTGPQALCGVEIPEAARILAVASTWTDLLAFDLTGGSAAIAECWRLSGGRLWPEGVRALTRPQALEPHSSHATVGRA